MSQGHDSCADITGLACESIHWTRLRVSFLKIHTRQIDIDHGCLDVGVAKESLKAERIASVLDEVSSMGMPQEVRVNSSIP